MVFTQVKCQGCQTSFHSSCKRKILKERVDPTCIVVTNDAAAVFLCNACYP